MKVRRRFASAALLGTLFLLVAGCASLPKGAQRVPSSALDQTQETRLGSSLAEAVGQHPGSSGVSLHAKVFVIDRARAFVGSLNLDPRSVDLNTELGIVVESHALASGSAD